MIRYIIRFYKTENEIVSSIGFPPNRLPSSSDSSFIDERKQKVVASPDSTTVTSGDRNSQMSGRGSINATRNKNKSNL